MRALLASTGFEHQPMKAVYFFPGEGDRDGLWTTHPLDVRHRQWNNRPDTRSWVLDRMIDAKVNTVVASYWGNMPQWSPMTLDGGSWRGLLDAVGTRPLVVLPALESGFDPSHPEVPHWDFRQDFRVDPATSQPAPGLVVRIGELVKLFRDRQHLWAQLYDLAGAPRYAINILHACSDVLPLSGDPDGAFASTFDAVAHVVRERFGIDVGFTLDPIPGAKYSPAPPTAGPRLGQTLSVLAIHAFASEVFSGLVRNAPPCHAADWRQCRPYDNNVDRLPQLADWKRAAIGAWLASGVPVVLDVTNGFDGRIVWRGNGAGFWGDNLDYTDDRWRNWMSQLKQPGIAGITFDTWNGYTEGYAGVPSAEHGDTVYRWLHDLLEPDPRHLSHMHYVNGQATHRVFGAICEKWIELGADRLFGAPVSGELPSAHGRKQFFAGEKSIYWGPGTGAHELHGLIGRRYEEVGGDASCLGLPISAEEAHGAGRISRFQGGQITWLPGATSAEVSCT